MSFYQKGKKNNNWKGGRKKTGGYIRIKNQNHPFSDSRGYVLEHRMIVEKKLKRTDLNSQFLITIRGEGINCDIVLNPDIIVHHRDGNKENNSEDNLEPMDKIEHLKMENTGEKNPMFGKKPWNKKD